jgi:DNA-binding MarR family transcriptional regulator
MNNKKYQHLALRLTVLSSLALKLVRHDIVQRLHKEHIKINPHALAVMRIIGSEQCTIATLSKRLMIAPASLVLVIDTLDKKGLVRRDIDPKDRRRNPLSLTHKGEQIISRASAIGSDDIVVKSLSRLGERKSFELLGLLEELVIILSGDKKIGKKVSAITKLHKGKDERYH